MDRLTQAQYKVAELAGLFFDTLGVVQRDAPSIPRPPPPLPGTTPTTPTVVLPEAFISQIRARAVNVIAASKQLDELIESLPGADRTEEQQLLRLAELEEKSRAAGEELEHSVKRAEEMIAQIRQVLHQIYEDRLH